jgi:TonB family protein
MAFLVCARLPAAVVEDSATIPIEVVVESQPESETTPSEAKGDSAAQIPAARQDEAITAQEDPPSAADQPRPALDDHAPTGPNLPAAAVDPPATPPPEQVASNPRPDVPGALASSSVSSSRYLDSGGVAAEKPSSAIEQDTPQIPPIAAAALNQNSSAIEPPGVSALDQLQREPTEEQSQQQAAIAPQTEAGANSAGETPAKPAEATQRPSVPENESAPASVQPPKETASVEAAPTPTPRPLVSPSGAPERNFAPPPRATPAAQRQPAPKPRRAERAQRLARAETAEEQPHRESHADHPASVPPPARATASAAEIEAYKSQMVARINAAKRYPEEARSKGMRGIAVVGFSITPSGRLGAASIQRTSGDAILDSDALVTLRRAAPFPAPPIGAPLAYSVALSYRVQ